MPTPRLFRRRPWHEWYAMLLGLLGLAVLFVFLATTFAEKHRQAFLTTSWFFVASLGLYGLFLWGLRRDAFGGGTPRAVLKWGSLGLTAFVLFLFVPFRWPSAADEPTGAPNARLDARDQAGSSLYAKAEGILPGDEITLTIFDICLGGIQNKARRDGPVSPDKLDIKDAAALTGYIKEQARALGAGIVGICELQQAHVFTSDHQGTPIDLRHKYAIVVGTDLPYNLALPTAPLPWAEYYSALPEELAALLADKLPKSGAPISLEELEKLKNTMRFFSEGGRTAVELARLIRSFGFAARAHYSRWSEVQIIPLAEAAGLGELGRNGLLLTKEYGPRGSFAVITTDLPLLTDPPARLGLREFCEDCAKCAVACPVQAIPLGGRKLERGVRKWVADGERCYDYLLSNPKCMACLGSCPFNKPDYLLHRVATYMGTRRNVVTNRLLVWVDDVLGYGDMTPFLTAEAAPEPSAASGGRGTGVQELRGAPASASTPDAQQGAE